jgi:hypothetical protein
MLAVVAVAMEVVAAAVAVVAEEEALWCFRCRAPP